MRFDDRLATILALPDDSQAARAAKWRQLVDLLAQRREIPDPGQLEQVQKYLREQRAAVDPAVRQAIAHSLAGRRVSPLLVRFFGDDDPTIATALVAAVRLSTQEWIELLPSLSVAARERLRRREDLPPDVVQSLGRFGASDARLSGARTPAATHEQPEEEGHQIRELVARIEEFRTRQQMQPSPLIPTIPDTGHAAEGFRWETGPDGVILWVEGAPRGPLIGQTIASVAGRGEYGVDGQAAGAFEKRTPFRDARFAVAGSGSAAGDWRLSGVPFFHPRHGSFLGYRGTARRPRVDEIAHSELGATAGGLFGTALPAESLRNLIHELRTPLNAIVGFAEMIDGQYLGPAGANYRLRARNIIQEADKILSAVDDLDTAARLETRRFDLIESSADAVALLSHLADAYGEAARQREAHIVVDIAAGLPTVRVDLSAAERMFSRMLAAKIGLLRPGESIGVSLGAASVSGRDMLCLAIDRPEAIHGLDEGVLLDPAYTPEGEWPGAPLLGLGFALRLVRNLAEAVGGSLVIGDRQSLLYLPAERAEQSTSQGH